MEYYYHDKHDLWIKAFGSTPKPFVAVNQPRQSSTEANVPEDSYMRSSI